MHGLQFADRCPGLFGCGLFEQGGLVESLWQRACAGPVRGHEVEQRPCGCHGCASLRMRFTRLVDLGLVCVGGPGEAAEGALGAGEQALYLVTEQARRLRVGVGVEGRHHLVEGADAGEAVAADEVVVEQRQRQAGDERVNPDGQPGEFHSYPVAVHAVDAMAGYLAAQQRPGFDLGACPEVAERLEGGVPQAVEFGAHGGHGVQRQPRRQPGLDAVERRHQEVARSHGDVGAAEVEERLGQSGVVSRRPQPVETGHMVVQRRFERVVQQVLHGERLCEVAAGGFADAGPVVQIYAPGGDLDGVVGARRDVLVLPLDPADRQVVLGHGQPRLQQALVDGAELADRQRPEVHRPVPLGPFVDEQRS